MFKKSILCMSIATVLTHSVAQAATIYEKENGDYLKVYGEVGVGGHFGADYEYGEFYTDEQSYIDDSFATLGLKGETEGIYYRLELDYQRENWEYGSGDMELDVDKLFLGYKFYKQHAIEVGLTDTALDDYDKYGDFTFDTTVETGEAGDQDNTIKYEGVADAFRMGISYTYQGESSSGSEQGDIVNGYVGYFSHVVDVVVGAETRRGSDGLSKYGEQNLFTFGLRAYVLEDLAIGVNGFIENEDISQNNTTDADGDTVYNDYHTLKNKGGLVSARFNATDKIELTSSINYEEYEAWDSSSAYGDGVDYSWGKERIWGTFGINFKPSRPIILAIELNVGEAAQDAYAYARIYF